jgi:hypothetical protein
LALGNHVVRSVRDVQEYERRGGELADPAAVEADVSQRLERHLQHRVRLLARARAWA